MVLPWATPSERRFVDMVEERIHHVVVHLLLAEEQADLLLRLPNGSYFGRRSRMSVS
jgi:hypothetical protein